MKRKNRFYLLIALPAFLLTLFIFVFPFLAVSSRSLGGMESLKNVFLSPYTYRLLSFTAGEAALSALISLSLALPFALFFSKYSFFGRRTVLSLSSAAFVLPSIIVVLSFVIWYGNNGILSSLLSFLTNGKIRVTILYSYPAIILSHVYLNFPLAFSVLTTAVMECGDTEENAALLLGRRRASVFRTITLKKIRGSIAQTFLMVFLFCFPSFLIVMTLGGNPKFYTIEAEIYRRAYMDGDTSSASSLALFSFLVMSFLLILSSTLKKEKKIYRNKKRLIPAEGKTKAAAVFLNMIILLFMLPPLLSVLYRSLFTKDGTFSTLIWKNMILSPVVQKAVLTSIVIALFSSTLAVRMASALTISQVRERKRLIPVIASLPMALGSVTLGLGFSFLSSRLNIRGEAWGLVITVLAHTGVLLPFAFRTISQGAGKISENLQASAVTLKPSITQCYRKVEKPALRQYILRSFAFSFVLSLGETNATLALANGNVTTLPILIYKMISQYNYQGASCLSVIMLFLSFVVFAVTEKTGEKNVVS